jgi:hypothetical protein
MLNISRKVREDNAQTPQKKCLCGLKQRSTFPVAIL